VTPLVINAIDRRTAVFTARPALRMPATLAVVGCMIQLAVPLTFGIFRQDMVVDTAMLEPHLHTRASKVYFNKGL